MDDAEAIESCQQGDREAFLHLVERYQKRAVAQAMAILLNRDDAEDAVQEATRLLTPGGRATHPEAEPRIPLASRASR